MTPNSEKQFTIRSLLFLNPLAAVLLAVGQTYLSPELIFFLLEFGVTLLTPVLTVAYIVRGLRLPRRARIAIVVLLHGLTLAIIQLWPSSIVAGHALSVWTFEWIILLVWLSGLKSAGL